MWFFVLKNGYIKCMSNAIQLPSILRYKSYREFLKDWFDAKKECSNSFSHRRLAQLAGFKSPNFILLIIQGKRNLGLKTIPTLAKALKLKRYEEQYLDCLVRLEQSDSSKEKTKLVSKMLRIKASKGIDELGADLFKLYSQSENILIKEMIDLSNDKVTDEWIAQSSNKDLSKAQIKHALKTLCEIGLIKESDEKGYVSTQKIIRSGDDLFSVALSNFQQSMLQQALDSLSMLDGSRRDTSSLTMRLSWKQIEHVKEKFKELKKELIALEDQEVPDEVFQINFQLFPLTRLSPKMKLVSGE